MHLSGEFMNFLHNLGSRVFSLKAKKRFRAENGHEETTKAINLFSTRNVEAWKSEVSKELHLKCFSVVVSFWWL